MVSVQFMFLFGDVLLFKAVSRAASDAVDLLPFEGTAEKSGGCIGENKLLSLFEILY